MAGRSDALDHVALVTALYRAILDRDPDDGGMRTHLGAIGAAGLESTIRSFLTSDEYRGRARRIYGDPGYQSLNLGPPMSVETRVSAEELSALWNHIAEVWRSYGRDNALWSVISEDRFSIENNPSPELIQEFYGNQFDLHYTLAFLGRAGLRADAFPVVAEYGCGVGRVTRWLAETFRTVRAFDVSAPHLDTAKAYLGAQGVDNVDYALVEDRAALGRLQGVDLFLSLIVLQHNPPPVIVDILDRAFAALNPNGVALFQVPTYASDYHFDLDTYWRDVASRKAMEVHFVPQAAILDLARKHQLRVLECRPDHCIGHYDRWMSTTFMMRKMAPG